MSRLEFDDAIFDTTVAAKAGNSAGARSSRRINWQLQRNIRVMADGVLEMFDDDIAFAMASWRDRFIGGCVRFQLDF